MHEAYKLALTAQQLTAERALELRLIDELGEDSERALQRLLLRFKRIPSEGILKLKRYVNDVFLIDERVEALAVQTTTDLALEPVVRQRIHDFLTHQSLPWERESRR
jgi:enoyl-CoA hydratase/carnithine racemase